MDRKEHWERVYKTTAPNSVSWFQENPTVSARLLQSAGLGPETRIIDIGGGDSRLVDFVLGQGVGCVCVLDISAAALQRARERLGEAARLVNWIEADVTGDWHVPAVDVW